MNKTIAKNATDPWLWLKGINHLLERKSHIHEIINDRAAFYERANECVDADGVLHIEESGMDCDCVKYSGHLHHIQPTYHAWNQLHDELHMHAEGPFYLQIIPFDKIHEVKPEQRDLAMEAHEDGHDHIVYESNAQPW